jgi:putative redox protein
MHVSLTYLGDKKFDAKTSKSSFVMDCKTITPVEYFATGLIGCTGIDLVVFAEKDGYAVRNYSVRAEIERKTDVPMKFSSVHIVYTFDGSFEAMKAKRYILASLESYCTTVNSIRDSVKVYYTLNYNGEKIADKASILSGGGSGGEAIIEDGFGGACCS